MLQPAINKAMYLDPCMQEHHVEDSCIFIQNLHARQAQQTQLGVYWSTQMLNMSELTAALLAVVQCAYLPLLGIHVGLKCLISNGMQ